MKYRIGPLQKSLHPKQAISESHLALFVVLQWKIYHSTLCQADICARIHIQLHSLGQALLQNARILLNLVLVKLLCARPRPSVKQSAGSHNWIIIWESLTH